jgi:hypothetical protein
MQRCAAAFGPLICIDGTSERTRVDPRFLQLPHPRPLQPTVRLLPLLTPASHHQSNTATLRRRILTYLIPLRILRGHLPTLALLSRFPLLAEIYTPFAEAIRKGDVRAYDAALEKWEARLIEGGLWIVLEKGKEACLRGLFRRVYVFCCLPPSLIPFANDGNDTQMDDHV